MKVSLYLTVLVLFLTGCENSIDVNEKYDYSIEQQMICFCPEGGSWLKLFIVQDTISKAIRISDNQILSYNEFRFFKSIKGLFELITETDTSKYDLTVIMDPTGTYPSYLYCNPKPIVNGDTVSVIYDADISFSTRNYIKLK
jgi:hypothetical protein